MYKGKNIIIVLFVLAGFLKTQSGISQTRSNIIQATDEFKFTTWNTEWLSCSENGPTNDELQINNIVAVIKTMNSDLIALQEVGTSNTYTTIDTLVRRLGNEWAGSIIPSSNSNCGQNEGIIYKKSRVQLVSASLMNDAGSSYDWSSGRYPVLYNVNLISGSSIIPVSFVNIHAKAMGDETSYSRRKSASESLKLLLDGNIYNAKNVILLGDFNDYLTGTQCSSCSPGDSPYKNFVEDTNNYKCLTTGLYDPAYSSPVIDNIIISNELVDNLLQNSIKRETQATQGITNYTSTTSDHVPVSASFTFEVQNGGSSCENLDYSETFSTGLGNFIFYNVTGDQTWYWRLSYGACTSGYSAGINYPNENWLISPAFDLSDKASASLAFNHALNYCPNESDKLANQTLWVSANYNSGAPSSATWTQLTIPTMPSGSNWTFVGSGTVELPGQMLQNNVRFAFKYLSTSSLAGTWEIKDLVLNADCVSTGIPTKTTSDKNKILVSNRKIQIAGETAEPVIVFDITGRVLFSASLVQNIEISVATSGVYIVRAGTRIDKVIVN